MSVGSIGETAAREELQKRGYDVLDVNFRTRHGEIDIVAQDGGTTVFVEVKSRRSVRRGLPKEAVGIFKRLKLRKMALIWISRHPQHPADGYRFDVVSVFLDPECGVQKVEVLQHAF